MGPIGFAMTWSPGLENPGAINRPSHLHSKIQARKMN
jgi:hypothetical protein